MKKNIINTFPFGIKDESIIFHNFTDLEKFEEDDKAAKISENWSKTQYKGYPRFKKIKLPKPHSIKIAFDQILKDRTSVRKFSTTSISLGDLSTFLYYSSGIKDIKKDTENRFYPSAGSKYPLEIYLLILNCKGLEKGIYHYHLKSHSLEFLWKFNKDDIRKNFAHEWVIDSPFVVIISGVFYRNMIKYGNRGYRHILIEAGAMTQNFYLVATGLKMGCCSMGGFIDKGICRLLDIDISDEYAITCIAAGYKQERG